VRVVTSDDLAFIGIFSVMTALLAAYVWLRVVHTPRLEGRLRRVVTRVIVTASLSMPGALIVARTLPRPWDRLLQLPVYVWVGLVVVGFFLCLGAEPLRIGQRAFSLVGRLFGKPPDEERRLFFARALAAGIGGADLVLSTAGVAFALGALQVERTPIRLRRFPSALDGFRIVQLTDVHIGPTLGGEWLRAVVEQVNALAPDLVVITGDLVDGSVEHIGPDLAPLAALTAPHGVFFVTGNHEYYAGADAWIEELARLGVRTLRNERVTIGGEDGFELAGVDDWGAKRRLSHHGADLEKALRDWDGTREVVLLAHQPKQAPEAIERGVGLVLSGHTHGGQIFPWGLFVRLDQPYLRGLSKVGETHVYVSRGAGYWGPPMRIGSMPEIAVLELERA
jgi:predicted MPP superfamily phosphohydrolase